MIKQREKPRQETAWRKSAAGLRQRAGSSDHLERKKGAKSDGLFFYYFYIANVWIQKNPLNLRAWGRSISWKKNFPATSWPRWEATRRWNNFIWAPLLLPTELWGCEMGRKGVLSRCMRRRDSLGQAGELCPLPTSAQAMGNSISRLGTAWACFSLAWQAHRAWSVLQKLETEKTN